VLIVAIDTSTDRRFIDHLPLQLERQISGVSESTKVAVFAMCNPEFDMAAARRWQVDLDNEVTKCIGYSDESKSLECPLHLSTGACLSTVTYKPLHELMDEFLKSLPKNYRIKCSPTPEFVSRQVFHTMTRLNTQLEDLHSLGVDAGMPRILSVLSESMKAFSDSLARPLDLCKMVE
jgi:hypothetical protein